TILLVGTALPFDDEPYGIRESLGRVRHARRKQEDLAFPARTIHASTVLHRAQHHVAFDLIEELLARIIVIVAAIVRSADDHDDELRVRKDLLVAHRRFQELAMLVDPGAEIEGR